MAKADKKSFNDARANLAVTTRLMDTMRAQQMAAQQSQQMPQQAPEEAPMEALQEQPMEQPMAPEEEKKGMIATIQEAVAPMFDEMKKIFAAKDKEPKEVEVKIEGEMTPKEKE